MTKNPWWSRIVLTASLTPLLWLAWKWRRHDLGINSIEFVARYTGGWTLRFLLLTVSITPLRRIPGLRDLIRFRRLLGAHGLAAHIREAGARVFLAARGMAPLSAPPGEKAARGVALQLRLAGRIAAWKGRGRGWPGPRSCPGSTEVLVGM